MSQMLLPWGAEGRKFKSIVGEVYILFRHYTSFCGSSRSNV